MEMPELPIPSSEKKKTQQFSNFLIPLLILFSSFILSHPLYFLKLLSFLSPLLITTFLILLFTSYRALRRSAGNAVGEKGKVEVEVEVGVQPTEEDEVYKIFFEAPHLEDKLQEEPEELVDKFLICGDTSNGVGECLEEKKLQEDNDNDNGDKKDGNAQAEKTLEELFEEKEDGKCEVVVVEEKEEVKEVEEADREAKNRDLGSKTEECASRAWRNSRRLSNSLKIFEKSSGVLGDDEKMGLVLGGFGSMRRTEKEWKRTLACKLFEERHSNGEGGGRGDEEGMDLLWETYEKSDSPASLPGPDHGKKAAKESAKKMKKKELHKEEEEEEEEDDDGDEEEEEMNGQFCCLQALKLSAGKVNLGLGMGKPNIARISKAFRGIGWLHHGRARKLGLFH